MPGKLKAAFAAARRGDIRWPMFVTGKPGTGKTCGGLWLADAVAGSEFWTFDEFAVLWQDAKFGRAERIEPGRLIEGGGRELPRVMRFRGSTFWPWIERLSLVVVDDVGLRSRANDSQYEAMKMLLDKRAERPLVVTSNHDLETLGGIFDARVFDRLAAGTVVELQGGSMR